MPELYVKNGCPGSQKAMSMLAHAPTSTRNSIRVHEVTGRSAAPPSVTRVPTLLMQDGTMLSGSEVFQYLSAKRQDPSYPQTPEMSEDNSLGMYLETFVGGSGSGWIALLAILIALYLAYQYYTRRR